MAEKTQVVPAAVLALANTVRTAAPLKIRQGIMRDRRFDFFKLQNLHSHLVATQKLDAEQAKAKIESFLSHKLIHRIDREARSKTLNPHSDPSSYDLNSYYIWLYQGSSMKPKLYAAGVLIAIMVVVMFPLWPENMRIGVWYLSMAALGFVGFLLAVSVIRIVMFGLTKVLLSPGIWIFPNLYADVGFFASFVPLWGWADKDYLPENSGEKKAERRKQRKIEKRTGDRASSLDTLDDRKTK
jgi:translocation protein SEC62